MNLATANRLSFAFSVVATVLVIALAIADAAGAVTVPLMYATGTSVCAALAAMLWQEFVRTDYSAR